MEGLDSTVTMFVLTTANCRHANLPEEVKSLYNVQRGEVYEMKLPETRERESYFEQLFAPMSSRTSMSEDLSQKSSSVSSELMPGRKSSGEMNAGPKLAISGVQSVRSATSPSTSGIPLKREYSAAGETGASKRRKIFSGSATVDKKFNPRLPNLSNNRTRELTRKIVTLTVGYNAQHLEGIYAILELAIGNSDVTNMTEAVIECLNSYNETRKVKMKMSKKRDAENLRLK
ncbi:uncharacterized protein LOC125499863 [Athalia rosae]|uniref:uncharacterized protein LOC125499863 n=1 Tax=Athalia rosae TaxID=37344 RepID=UPI002033358C|nr:uncharacterized protein LOC125499863 [Athalia rosae]